MADNEAEKDTITIETTCTIVNAADLAMSNVTGGRPQAEGGTQETADNDAGMELDMSVGSPSNSCSGPSSPPSRSPESVTGNSRASSERGTPNKLRRGSVSRGGDSAPDNASTCSSSSSTTNPRIRLPNRPGIIWRKGEKVEAMDYMKKWYPAKIIEIDDEEGKVLIHFEGWNQRYDEWVDMSSDRLRPKMRHSERKEKKKKLSHEYKIGEQVYARWTDCKMYPAKINSAMSDGLYEVIFYDGFKKSVQSINIRPMPAEAKQQKIEIVHVLPKDTRKKSLDSDGSVKDPKTPDSKGAEMTKGKVQDNEGVKVKVQHKEDTKVKGIDKDGSKVKGQNKEGGKGNSQEKEGVQKKREPRKRDRRSSSSKPKKLIIAGSFLAKRDNSGSSTDHSTAVVKEAVVTAESPAKVETETVSLPVPLPVPEGTPTISMPPSPASSISSKSGEKKVKKRTVSPSVSETSSASESQSEIPENVVMRNRSTSAERVPLTPTPVIPGVPKKAFIIEQDHNHYKCMFDGCNKGFRKESLLEYHVKYYHTDGGRNMSLPPPRKRRKTTSMCSTDSDISISSKQTTPICSSKKRHMSESSAVEIHENIQVDLEESEETRTLKNQRTFSQDTMATEESMETEDELNKDEVVNCICLYNEENGLMIQCEVCLCWQHASCFDLTKETLPKKYVCFVCSDPTGVRESCRYIHEQDWVKGGQITTFNFLPHVQEDKKCKTIQATHSLVADIHNLNAVLHGVKQQIKCTKDPNSYEYKLWTRNIGEDESGVKKEEVKQESDDKTPEDNTLNDITDDSENVKPMVTDISENQEDSKPPDSDSSVNITKDSDKTEDSNSAIEEKKEVPAEDIKPDPDVSPSGEDTDVDVETMDKSTGSVDQSENQDIPTIKQEPQEAVPSGDETCKQGEQDVLVIENDPFRFCERNLLEHIMKIQREIDQRLDNIEEQVIALESAEPSKGSNILSDVPALKRSLHMLQSNLVKVKRMGAYHR